MKMALPLIKFEDTGRDKMWRKDEFHFLFIKFKIPIDIQKAFVNMDL